jgi:endonuclease G, mitochondrial
MKYVLSILAIAFSLAVQANPIDDKCSQFTKSGAPSATDAAGDQYLCRTNYAVLHSCTTRTARYVLDHITKDTVNGPAKRKNDFSEDTEVTENCRASIADYQGSGYDRGHLSPAAVNTVNDDVMNESFLLSNMIPQDPGNNRGIWRMLELWVRDQVRAGNDVYVVSGTIYEAGYKKVGATGVPTKVYKIVTDATTGKTIAFLFPNSKLSAKEWPNHTVSVKELEQLTGIDFKTTGVDESVKYTVDNWKN